MDDENLGFYYISFGEDYWEELENVKLYEVELQFIIGLQKYEFFYGLWLSGQSSRQKPLQRI